VVAGRGVDADALSTATFVLGPTAGKELLENLRVHGLFVTSTGEIRTTENWCVLL
jgi:thiamine biosynthesis lipoprotein ApbE